MHTISTDELVSVIMGVCYRSNNTENLQRSILSILNQSYSHIEFLICENGSYTPARELIEKYAQKDPRIRLINGNGANSLTAKLNRCIYHARGNWIARMDDDDYSYPNRLEKQIFFLKENPSVSVVGCWVIETSNSGKYLRKLPLYPDVNDFKIRFPFVHPSLLFRKNAVLDVGLYSEKRAQVGCDDYELLMRMYEYGYKGANIPAVYLEYSIAASQLQKRPYYLFINEFLTRLECFTRLGLMPRWTIWAIKPLITGLIPRRFLYYIKHKDKGKAI